MKKRDELQKKISKKNSEVTKYDFTICPNCGHEEVGKFCPNCGQSNKDFNKPLKDILDDLLDSINLDIRLVNTLIPFFTKPGFLTQEYFKGRRKRYVPPMRMYMFFSILFFFLVQYKTFDDSDSKDSVPENKIGLNENEGKGQSAFNKYFNVNTEGDAEQLADSISKDLVLSDLTKEDKDFIREQMAQDSVPDTMSKIFDGAFNASEKKELFLSKFLKSLSYVLFILMPFFALILAMILWKSKMLYVKHLIFSINFHSFIFGWSSIIILLEQILPDTVAASAGYLYWGVPVYLMIGIKRFYNRKYVGAFFKTLGALTIYSLILSIVVVAILAITVQGFSNG